MKKLSSNWITEKLIDFEYKKYVLLAYLQEVNSSFEKTHLYPFLSDLVDHYRNLLQLKENKQALYETFPERLTSADFMNFNLVFRKIIQDDSLMQEIESIIDFSIPEFEKQLHEGKKIFDFIENHINIQPVGVLPINPAEGYFILSNGSSPETRVFEYQITIYENPEEKYRGIYTQHLTTYQRSLSNTNESIKSDLIRFNRKLPNPATYSIESEMTFPFTETLIPVAKRTFIKYLSGNSIC